MWSLILFIAILETIGMSIIEDSANKKNYYFILGLIFYMIVVLQNLSFPLNDLMS